MSEYPATAGQTVGPFFHYALPFAGDSELVPPGHPEAIRLHGTIYDGANAPIPDALVEVWQADPTGAIVAAGGSMRRDGWTFTGWGRAATDANGHYSFTTLTPGSGCTERAPFFALTIFARGLLDALFTRAYLPRGNLATDQLLRGIDDARRQSLICQAEQDGYRFDVRLQGEDETVFLCHEATQR
ncbi:MAG: protocatechuate 3,4-dioxygenase subunit alpha [Mycobacterium sp.]